MRTGRIRSLVLGLALALPTLGPREDAAREAETRVHELRKEKRYKEALAYLDVAVPQNPDSGNLRGLYCWIHLEDLKDPKAALDYALRLKKDLPKHPGGYYWSAKAYEAMGNYEACVSTLDDFQTYGRDFARDNVKASCYYKNGRLEEAISALPDEEKLQDNYKKYAGWPYWLKGQIARRKLFQEIKPRLQVQATAADARERAIALAKLAILGIPDGALLAELAGAADKGLLRTVADNLKKELTAEPRFYRELDAPKAPEGARIARLEDAFAEIWKVLDETPRPGRIPPMTGKYMTKEMLENVKRFPELATSTFNVVIDEAGSRYNFGTAWSKADGSVDTSFEPGRWYSISSVKDGGLWTVSAGLQNRRSTLVATATRPDGTGLVSISRSWTDMGDSFSVSEAVTKFLRVP